MFQLLLSFVDLKMAYIQSGNVVVLSNVPTSIYYKPENSSLLLVNNTSSQNNNGYVNSIVSTFAEKQIVRSDGIQVLDDTTLISKESIKEHFLKLICKQTGKEGLFIFSYTGPVDESSQECSLKLSDFNSENPITHVTPITLLEWLSEASKKQTIGYVLFIFDCPFAHRMVSCLTDIRTSTAPLNTRLFAVDTEVGDTNPMLYTALKGQTVFQYFLNWSIQTMEFTRGMLPLASILEKVSNCTGAFSSLIVTYNKQRRELKPRTTEPKLKSIQRIETIVDSSLGEGKDEIDSFSGLEFLNCHFERSKNRMNLDQKVYQWLDTLCDVRNENNPLKVLLDNGALEGPHSVLGTVLCLLMYSIASIQIAQGRKESIEEPNMFIIGFVSAVSTVQIVYRDGIADLVEVCMHSWEFYHHVAVQNNMKDDKLVKLYHLIETESKKSLM